MTRSLPHSFVLAPAALAVAAVLVLGCAGSGKKGVKGTAPRVWQPTRADTTGPVLAIVGTRRITRHDIDSLLAPAPQSVRDQYRDPALYKELIERLVEQEAIYQEAVRQGTENDAGYRTELSVQARQLLMKHYYQNAVQSLPTIPDTAVTAYYRAHESSFKIPGRARVKHIQLSSRARALQVLKQLRAGGRWDVLCAKYSTDKGSAKNSGILGFVVSDTDVVPVLGKAPAIVAAAFALKEGETSEPLKSDRGWHLIRVENVTKETQQSFSVVEKQIRSSLEGDRNEAFQTTLIDSLKRRVGVTIFDDSLRFAVHPAKTPADLFQEAQGAPTPFERIQLFQQVVDQFPTDKAAMQASFMIGFTYAEELTDYAAARKAFQEFLRRYPQSDLVTSAKWMLENMGTSKTPPGIRAPMDSIKVLPAPGSPSKGTDSTP